MIKYLRGVLVNLDKERKCLHMVIRKPLGDKFSISDKVKSYIDRGWKTFIQLPTETIVITKEKSYAKKETRLSKFSGAPHWYLYWYSIKEIKRQDQSELFA